MPQMLRRPLNVLLMTATWMTCTLQAEDPHDHHLHFTHPLFTESPVPETKVRLDYQYANRAGDEKADENTLQFVGEYAFNAALSVEFALPWTHLNPADEPSRSNAGDIEIAMKYADDRHADHGWLFGGGLAVILPTGDDNKDIGSKHILEVEPFLNAGCKAGDWEFIGQIAFGFPTNTHGEPEPDWIFEWHFSALHPVAPRLKGMVELFGESVHGGDEDGHNPVYGALGLSWQPTDDERLILGVAVALPLSRDRENEAQALLSLFFHE